MLFKWVSSHRYAAVIYNSPAGKRELAHLQVPLAAAKIAAPPRVAVHLVNHHPTPLPFSQLKSKNVGGAAEKFNAAVP